MNNIAKEMQTVYENYIANLENYYNEFTYEFDEEEQELQVYNDDHFIAYVSKEIKEFDNEDLDSYVIYTHNGCQFQEAHCEPII